LLILVIRLIQHRGLVLTVESEVGDVVPLSVLTVVVEPVVAHERALVEDGAHIAQVAVATPVRQTLVIYLTIVIGVGIETGQPVMAVESYPGRNSSEIREIVAGFSNSPGVGLVEESGWPLLSFPQLILN